MPRRTDSPDRLYERLTRLGFQRIHILPWQDFYDLVWARKPGHLGRRTNERPWQDFLTDGAAVTVVRPPPGLAALGHPPPRSG